MKGEGVMRDFLFAKIKMPSAASCLLQAFVRRCKGERGGCDERFFICPRPVLQIRDCRDNLGIIINISPSFSYYNYISIHHLIWSFAGLAVLDY